jgi:hypothetical protein
MKAAETAAMKTAKPPAMETTSAPSAVEASTSAAFAVRGVGEIRRRQRRDTHQCGREKSRCPAYARPGARGPRANHNLAGIDAFHEDLLLCVGRPTGRPRPTN